MAAQYGSQWQRILDVFVADRKALLVRDSWRSVLFILPVAILLWLTVNAKIKKSAWVAPVVALLVLVDLWMVDRRYLNKDNFIEQRKLKLVPSAYDKELDRQADIYGDKDYRVLNLAVNTFNDSQPSAFHHQIGGYSAAKLRRYQDIIDFYFNGKINMNVLNMLNTRYVVNRDAVRRNPGALGNAWFVEEIKPVDNPNEEILALENFDPGQTAIVDMSKWKSLVEDNVFEYDPEATIDMIHKHLYTPDHLTYNTHATQPQLAVFSEIYYSPDWFAYIDGVKTDYFRTDYLLRAMFVPAGEHTIEFRNEAPRMHQLDKWTIAFSVLLCLVVVGILVLYYFPIKKKEN